MPNETPLLALAMSQRTKGQSEGLSQGFLGGPTCFIYRAVTFFNKINLYLHNSYRLRNTIKLICRSGSIIN